MRSKGRDQKRLVGVGGDTDGGDTDGGVEEEGGSLSEVEVERTRWKWSMG